jgi:hypothetical protein
MIVDTKDGDRFESYLDGEKIYNCFTANDSEGTAESYELDRDGNINRRIKHKGNIEIKKIDNG